MAVALEEVLIAEAWAALTDGSAGRPEVESPAVTGEPGSLAARLPAEAVAVACVATAVRAAAALCPDRVEATLDREHVAFAVRSERYFRRGGASAGLGFAPLSKFWQATGGWVRTHANYPWHRAALLSVLGVDADADADVVGRAIGERPARDLEEAVFAAGGVTAAVRSLEEWRGHPQGMAVSAEPLVSHRAEPGGAARGASAAGDGPAAGVRVLDLTRVIAGPVCTRYLGALGAEVLRLDPPQRLDIRPGHVADTLLAKRSAFLDVMTTAGEADLHALLDAADVVVCGYRPGALDRVGLAEDALVERHPGLVVVYLDAWGHTGPWAGRRGFDSVVQAATGIAACESEGESPAEPPTGHDDVEPGTLPCQLLDHGTGYLAAAAVLDGLRRQRVEGGTHIRRLSLTRTAAWLTAPSVLARIVVDPQPQSSPEREAREGAEGPWLQHMDAGVVAVRPPGAIDGRVLRWPEPAARYGADPPAWG